MPASAILLGFPAVVSWAIGPLTIRGGDVYAIIGLITVFALLLLWVVVGHLLRTRRSSGEGGGSHAPEDTTMPPLNASGRIGPETEVIPVRARPEWLLDDNTLVRTRAVRREPVRRPAAPSHGEATDTARTAPGEASGNGNTPPARP